MAFVQQIAQRVTVLHFGPIFAQGTVAEIIANEAVAEIYFGHVDLTPDATPRSLLTMSGLRSGYGGKPVLQGVDLDRRQGEHRGGHRAQRRRQDRP